MDLNITGRQALVTGAGAGIGRAVAVALAAHGAQVTLVGRRRKPLEETRALIVSAGGLPPLLIEADLADGSRFDDLVDQIGKSNQWPHILVNNVGGSRPMSGPGLEEAWAESLSLNFHAARRLSEALVPEMRRAGWGRIVNLTGAITQKRVNAASPAKAALHSWSYSFACQNAAYGITVNCIAPGRINTVQVLERLHPTESSRSAFIADNIPAGRFGEPQEVADLAVFLCSPCAAYITGASIPIDGGMARWTF